MKNNQDKLPDRAIRPDMDSQKLQHFLAVFEHCNFRRAAEIRNVTQQAVSKAVARLEDQLGLPLFERTSRGVIPTSYARALARHAKTILSEINLATAELMAMRGSTKGFVTIGLGWSLVPRIGPYAIEEFRQRRPEIGLKIVEGNSAELFPKLLSGELDFVVSIPPQELTVDEDLDISQILYVEKDITVARKQHPLASKNRVDLADLSKYAWLTDLSRTEQWYAVCEKFVRQGVAPPKDIVDVNSLSIAKSMMAHGDYIGLFSEELCALELERGVFNVLNADLLSVNRTATLTTRRGSELQPAAQILSSIITKVCRQFYPQVPTA